MKSLNEYITESLLDDLEDLEKDSDHAMDVTLIQKFLDKNYRIDGKHTIKDGVVDVKGSVTVRNKKLTGLTNGLFTFGEITGNFECIMCNALKTLKGAPKEVSGVFDCRECMNLTSLKGSPETVGRLFNCTRCNSLTSLKDAPKEVGGNFECSGCDSLTSLKGSPEKVGYIFICSLCRNLKSLEGALKEVHRSFYCYG